MAAEYSAGVYYNPNRAYIYVSRPDGTITIGTHAHQMA